MALSRQSISFEESRMFSPIFRDFMAGRLKEFHEYAPGPEGIEAFIKDHNYDWLDRSFLAGELEKQYEGMLMQEAVKASLSALRDKNTYTVITGHQLCLATGPLYFIYKILSAIRIVEALNARQNGKKFIPVYWMATEDHDVEEINHVVLFNKKYTWATEQQGRVGAFSTRGIDQFLQEIGDVLGDNATAEHIIRMLEKAYSHPTLAEATRFLVNELFGKYGVVVADGNTAAFKRQFTEEMQRDALESFAFKAVQETSRKLAGLGYEPQVTPREINSFYAAPGLRERIVYQDKIYKVLNTTLRFSAEELGRAIAGEPERFSPNVVLRPLYQQKILPNAVYVGGPGEIAYWLQYRKLFAEAGIPFPVIVPRNFVMYVEKGLQQRLEKLKLRPADFFSEKAQLLRSFALQQQPFSLEREMELLRDVYGEAKSRIGGVDKTLEAATEAELQRALKGLETLGQKAIRSIKQRSEQLLNQAEAVHARFFPGGEPQERVENFLRFYISNPQFIDEVKDALEPFPASMHILQEA
jgi:bacillithiol synthase